MSRTLLAVLLVTVVLAGCAPATAPAASTPTAIATLPAGSATLSTDPSGSAPSPTVARPGEADLGDTRYSCGDPPGFLPAILTQPANAELENHPTAAALRAAIAEHGADIDLLPPSGYWLVHRDGKVADYLARAPGGGDPTGGEPEFVSARIDFQGGAWTLGGWGQCRPVIVLEGVSVANWVLDPDLPRPDAQATTFTALVSERACTSGQPMGDRLQPPSITYGHESVLVVFAARPLQSENGFDCQGNPSMRVAVQLSEPLGERHLLDASMFPPAEPVAPQF